MDNELIVSIFLICVILLSIDIFRRVIGELFRIQRQQKVAKEMRRLRKPVQPWVTILLYGDTSKTEITEKSLRKNRYHNYDTVLIGPRARTYQTAYRKSKRGKIIIPLPMGIEVDPNFIKRTVAMKEDRRSWKVEVEQSIREATGLTEIVTRLQKILWGRPIKIEAFISADLKKKKIQNPHTILPVITGVLAQLISIGLIVAGISFSDLTVLWYAWVLVSAYLFILVWFSNGIKISERLSLSMAIPSALFLIPVTSSIEGFFQLSSRK